VGQIVGHFVADEGVSVRFGANNLGLPSPHRRFKIAPMFEPKFITLPAAAHLIRGVCTSHLFERGSSEITTAWREGALTVYACKGVVMTPLAFTPITWGEPSYFEGGAIWAKSLYVESARVRELWLNPTPSPKTGETPEARATQPERTTAVVRAEADAAEWLRRYVAAGMPRLTRDAALNVLKAAGFDRLTERGFLERVWAAAAPIEWRASGAPKKSPQ
jgi:hypothetical protein